jgi:hypothetical protein
MVLSPESCSFIDGSHEDSSEESLTIPCVCENQLAHYDWNGDPHMDLPEQCRLTIRNFMPSQDESEKDSKMAIL